MSCLWSERLKTSIAGLVFGAIISGIGLLALIGSWGGHWVDLKIQEREGQSIGHLTGKEFSQPDDWSVNYWFLLPDGQKVEVRYRNISESLWQRLKVGDHLDIRYELKNPTRNFPVNEGNTPIAPVIVASVVGLAFVIFGLLLIIGSVKHRRAIT